MAIRYIPKKLESSDWTRVSGRCLYILCIEGNCLVITVLTPKCLFSWLLHLAVDEVHCQMTYSFEDECLKYDRILSSSFVLDN